MGKKGSKAAAPVTTTPQVQTPDIDVAQVAAEKALAAQGDVRASQAAEDESQKKQGAGLAMAAPQQQQPRKLRPQRDPAALAQVGGMNTSAVLTG